MSNADFFRDEDENVEDGKMARAGTILFLTSLDPTIIIQARNNCK